MAFQLDVKFEHMMTPQIIKIVYVLGILVIALGGVVVIAGAFLMPLTTGMTPSQGIVAGLGLIIVGPLILRLACEQAILLYQMFEHLQRIESKLRPPTASAGRASGQQQQ